MLFTYDTEVALARAAAARQHRPRPRRRRREELTDRRATSTRSSTAGSGPARRPASDGRADARCARCDPGCASCGSLREDGVVDDGQRAARARTAPSPSSSSTAHSAGTSTRPPPTRRWRRRMAVEAAMALVDVIRADELDRLRVVRRPTTARTCSSTCQQEPLPQVLRRGVRQPRQRRRLPGAGKAAERLTGVRRGRRRGSSPSRPRRPPGSPADQRGDRQHRELVELASSAGIGSVLVTMTSRGAAVLQPVDRRVGEDRVGRGDDDARGAVGHQGVGRLGDGAAGVDHVVDEDADPALDLTDDAVGDGLVGAVDVARLVDEGQRRPAEPLRPLLGDLDPAGVGRDDGELLVAVLARRRSPTRIGSAMRWSTGPSKKPWIWAVCRSTAMSRSAPAVLNRSAISRARDRLAAAVLLVLPGVAVERAARR